MDRDKSLFISVGDLTRWASRAAISPNFVTALGATFCALAFTLFWVGDYWLGAASGLIFMVLDTVDGQLARCTDGASTLRKIFDHGVGLIHQPLWGWAWLHGLAAYGHPLDPVRATMAIWVILISYVLQRLTERIFLRHFGTDIHVWERLDSRFHLMSAGPNPNLVILVASLMFRRPDIGLLLVAGWAIISLFFHAVRLAHAGELVARGGTVRSWLA